MAATPPTGPPTVSARVPIPRNGVDYRGVVALAPMVRSGELPTRLLALSYGADLVWGPETIDRSLIGTMRRVNPATGTVDFTRAPSYGGGGHKSKPEQPPTDDAPRENVIYRLHPAREARRLIFQLGTAQPETAVAAARLVAADVAGIDVNAGCPKPFSTSGGMGAALLRNPTQLAAILRALVASVGKDNEIGISVKIRVLPEPADTRELVRLLVRTGITGLSVHCRTPSMRPRERAVRAQLRDVVNICHEAGVACLMNGDVADRDAAVALAVEFGADGALIATAAEANPSVFRTKADGGPAPWREVAHGYMRGALEVENKWGNTKFMLAQLIPGKSPEGRAMQLTKRYQDAVKALGLEEEFGERAEAVDEKVGLGPNGRQTTTHSKKRGSAQLEDEREDTPAKKRAIVEDKLPDILGQTLPTNQQAMAV